MKPAVVWLLLGIVPALARGALAAPGPKADSRSPRLHEATLLGHERAGTQHSVVISLDLRNRAELEAFLADVQNPDSPNYGRFITQDEFNARFAPSAAAEQRVIDYLQANGAVVTDRFPNMRVKSENEVDAAM